LIATTVAGQPFCAGKKRGSQSKESYTTKALSDSLPTQYKALARRIDQLESHPVLDTLADPSEFYCEWSLKFATAASLELTGRALWILLEDNGKRGIFPIPVSWVSEVNWVDGIWYIRRPGTTKELEIASEFMAHFFYPNPSDPTEALSPLSAVGMSVIADEAIQTAQSSAFQNGLYPGLAVRVGEISDSNGGKYRPELNADQRKTLIGTIRAAVGGANRNGEPVILDNMIEDVFPITRNPAEMGFLDSGRFTEKRIQHAFGVNPILLGEIEGANRASSTSAEHNFNTKKINPLLALISQTATEWLAPWYKDKSLVVWLPECVAHDAEIEIKKWAISGKHATVNEHRARLGLPPIKGGDAREFKALGRALKNG
jgi:phage portal protein BeeE